MCALAGWQSCGYIGSCTKARVRNKTDGTRIRASQLADNGPRTSVRLQLFGGRDGIGSKIWLCRERSIVDNSG